MFVFSDLIGRAGGNRFRPILSFADEVDRLDGEVSHAQNGFCMGELAQLLFQ